MWKGYYDRTLAGERFSRVIDSGVFPEKTYREYWFNPIRNEQDEVTGLSIFSRDITEARKAEIRIRQLLLDSLEATENLRVQEEKMRNQMSEYEKRIRELEENSGVSQ
ncbi:MAG: hypothetical protein HC880_12390 [Bacteroidia bacterium]|nr:hypothetical protein [Bacteroidia bacterium]